MERRWPFIMRRIDLEGREEDEEQEEDEEEDAKKGGPLEAPKIVMQN